MLSIILNKRMQILNEKKEIYNQKLTSNEVEQFQLEKFNSMWLRATNEITFYKYWKKKFNLPDEISSMHDLEYFPVLHKEDINHYHDLIFDITGPYRTISTGGSTGVPTRFPVYPDELDEVYANVYLCRGWWGIKPFEKATLLWGHSHLFGTGIKGKINEQLRQIKDYLIHTQRLNAYDMRPDTIEKYYNKMIFYNPSVIIGYSSSLYKMSKFILDNGKDEIQSLNLKAVIFTAETLSEAEARCIQRAFCAPLVSEYGSAELGVLSYSSPSEANAVLWDTYYCYADSKNILHATSLNHRAFPLINYFTGDVLSDDAMNKKGILSFKKIVGREQQSLKIKSHSGSDLVLSGILFVHIMKNYPSIYSVQCKQIMDDKVLISLVSSKQLDLVLVKRFFYNEISKTHPKVDWRSIEFEQVSDVSRSLAGKEKVIS